MKNLIRKFVPRCLLEIYHKTWVILAALVYGFPGRHLKIIGVTGTDGKSTTVHLIARILEEAGFKVGAISTVMFKKGQREWINKTRLTMLGRFSLQKFLRELVDEKYEYAVVESSSEGLMQWRHWGIDYQVAVLTNLTPEHLSAHGGFANYRSHKGRLFASLAGTKRRKPQTKTASIVNLVDENSEYFLNFSADEKWGYGITNYKLQITNQENLKQIIASEVQLKSSGSTFKVNDQEFTLQLLGDFNLENALAAIAVGFSQNIEPMIIAQALVKVKIIPGRLEKIETGQNFTVIVDYAHTPGSFKKFFKTLRQFYPKENYIAVFGSAGGVRDKVKRPQLGKIADAYCAKLIFTNEDPYDTPPQEILKDIASGLTSSKKENQDYWLIEDRRQAIRQAFQIVQPQDVVLILGKGTEPCIKIGQQKIPWDDRDVVREELLLKKHH